MATYTELRNLFNDADLLNRVEVALVVYAQSLIDKDPQVITEQKYADKIFSNTNGEAKKVLMGVLAKNSTATAAQIKSAPDNTLQTNVNAIADSMLDVYTAGGA